MVWFVRSARGRMLRMIIKLSAVFSMNSDVKFIFNIFRQPLAGQLIHLARGLPMACCLGPGNWTCYQKTMNNNIFNILHQVLPVTCKRGHNLYQILPSEWLKTVTPLPAFLFRLLQAYHLHLAHLFVRSVIPPPLLYNFIPPPPQQSILFISLYVLRLFALQHLHQICRKIKVGPTCFAFFTPGCQKTCFILCQDVEWWTQRRILLDREGQATCCLHRKSLEE
jgi:hypothetical protein